MMNKRVSRYLSGIVLAFVCLNSAMAATITHVGTVTNNAGNEITEWRTPGTAKSFDADGNNDYGTAGRLFFIVQGAFPPYAAYASSQTQVGPFGGYVTVDHPDGVSADTQVRTTTSGVVAVNSTNNMFWFNIVSAVPPTFRVGIAFDGLNGVVYSPKEIRLTQLVGGAATDSVVVDTFRDNTIDMVFFDVSGARVGDQFSVQGIAGAGGYATHQFVTWDELNPHQSRDGDVIAVDFANTGGAAAGYNLFTAESTLAAGSVINTEDAALTNVSIALSCPGALGFNNDGNAANWPGTGADPYYVTDADDITFTIGVDPITVTFGGLPQGERYWYTLRVHSLIGVTGTLDTKFTVAHGGADRVVINTRGSRWAAATLEADDMVFENLRADGSGEISVEVDPNGTNNTFLNALVLEVHGIRGTTFNFF